MDTTTSAQHSTASIDFMGSITIVHIVLMAVLAAAAILVIWYGSVLRRRRREADRQVAENREIAEEAGATAPSAVESPMGSDLPATTAPPEPEPTRTPAPPAPTSVAEAEPVREAPAAPVPEGAERAAEPVSVIIPTPEPAPAGGSELTQLKGLGPKLATTLAELGYTRVDQIADLSPAEAEALDALLGAFQGRMARDRWIEQARLLTAGDRSGYEAAFGKL
jgi:predicted flap endonuclease-1-like 5' DNA nuclease